MHVRNDEKSAVGHSGFLFHFLFVLHDLQRGLVAPRNSNPNASQTPGSGCAAAVKLQYSWVTSLWKSEYIKKKIKKQHTADTNRPAEQVVWEAEATRAEG